MTDVRRRGVPPPSPHWKGPLAQADRQRAVPIYGANRLRPKARSLAVPGRLAMLLLGIQIAGLLALAVGTLMNLGYFTEWHKVWLHNPSDQVQDIMNRRYHDTYGIAAGVLILLGVNTVLFTFTFVWWTQRAYRNLVTRELNVAWAYLGFFVPIVNLWKPKQIANRIWRGTVSSSLDRCVQWWWFGPYFLLLGVPIGWLMVFFGGGNGDYEVIGVVSAINLVLYATIPMALFQMIRRVTRSQEPLIVAARAQAEAERYANAASA